MDRPLYILPFRVVVLALGAVLLLGLAAGAIGAALVLRRVLVTTPGGERVIERTERVTVVAEDALAAAADTLAPSTALLLDSRGRIAGTVVAVTRDGVALGVGTPPKGALSLRRLGGETVPTSLLRVYPGVGLFAVKADAAFPALSLERESVRPGATLAVVAPTADGLSPRVRVVTVEAEQFSAVVLPSRALALARVPVFGAALPPSFVGAPAVGTDGRVRGLAVIEGGNVLLLPGSLVDSLLTDLLQYPQPDEVAVLTGLRGQWQPRPNGDAADLVFRVHDVTSGSAYAEAGLRSGDEIVAAGDEPLRGVAPLFLRVLAAARAGEELPLSVQRAEETLTLGLTVMLP